MFGFVWVARSGERIFHYLFITSLAVGTVAYYAQASDLAWKIIPQPAHTTWGNRQIFWPKYVLWVVEFPVMSVALGLLSGVSWTTIFYEVVLCWIWIISYLCGAFTGTSYKWGFFAFGSFAWLLLAVHTLFDGTLGARRMGVARDHTMLAVWINTLWLAYVIGWGVADGGNYIGITPSFIWYGILDTLFTPFTCWIFMFLARNWDYNRLNIAFTQYGRVNQQPGRFPEKNEGVTAPAADPAATAPAAGTTV